ncbi:hypothetical protein GGI11_004971 [Coemansia sp. RSA 2049]|nr:hypothetical protein GGI11_004971 [Coemansia sp. RSA 2049]KAJ2515620.1 hypothetical protein H4217_005060 [Coemansia sp. RSA 1939]KAJ2607570.1 hypothetical protein EV177_005440 [Coemansia sp. RSA 1804]KAJ2682422.1 hypothetical protein GGH99_004746 [Coemansia sp. RSA 1285]
MDDGTAFTARGIFQSALQQQQQQVPRRTVDVGGLSARATRVSIAGVSRIRPAVLDRLSHGVLMATTVGEIAQEAREAGGRLQALGIAKEARVVLDQAAAEDDGRQGVAVDVGLECTDGPRYSIKTEAGVDDTEGTAGVAARMANIFGGGESADIHYARGTRTQAAFQGVFAAPVDADPHRLLSIAVTQRLTSHRPHSAHDEALREVGVAYRAADPARPAAHDLAYSLAWRNLSNLGADASPTLRTEAGHSLKSAVRHTVAIDTRDSARVPSRGSLLRLTSEAAALGDARFVKTRAELQTNQSLGAGFVASSALQAGVLWSLGSRVSPLADRFFLGGSASVRGFQLHGIGPRDGSDSIGGDVFYAAGVSLLTPLPFVATPALRGHVWANAGQLALLDARGLLRNCTKSNGGLASSLAAAAPEVRRFLVSPSAAVGVGLVYNHPVVRAEVSLCLPIAATPTDRPKPGLQFGLGLAFL